MADDIHTPDKSANYSIRDTAPTDKGMDKGMDQQPWNKSQIEIEPAEETKPAGQFSDRIKLSPYNKEGKAGGRALKGWPEGQKKA